MGRAPRTALRDRTAPAATSSPGAAPIGVAPALAANARRLARPLVDVCLQRFPHARRGLDLGGGHGEQSLEFARRGLRATVQDLPDVIDIVEHPPAAAGIGDGRSKSRASTSGGGTTCPRLGCELDDHYWVRTGATGRTSAPGVWAAGNVADPRAQVSTAAAVFRPAARPDRSRRRTARW